MIAQLPDDGTRVDAWRGVSDDKISASFIMRTGQGPCSRLAFRTLSSLAYVPLVLLRDFRGL